MIPVPVFFIGGAFAGVIFAKKRPREARIYVETVEMVFAGCSRKSRLPANVKSLREIMGISKA